MNRKILAMVIAWIAAACVVSAAERTWTGGGGDGNWSTPGNWSGGVPGASDTAIFNATTNTDCILDQSISVLGIRIEAGYSGTISQGAWAITVGTNDFSQAGGTFTGGTTNITVNGSFLQSGGAFTGTAGRFRMNINVGTNAFTRTGGTYDHNGGEFFVGIGSATQFSVLKITAGGCTFNRVTIDYGSGTNAQLTPMDGFTVEGDFRFLGNRTSSYGSRFTPPSAVTITVQGNLIKEDGYNITLGNANVTFLLATTGQTVYCGHGGIGGPLLFQGSGDQTITNFSSTTLSNLTLYGVMVDKAAGTLHYGFGTRTSRIQVNAGNTLNAHGHDLWPSSSGGFIQNHGTITNAPPNLDIGIPLGMPFTLRSGDLSWSNVTFRGLADTSGSAITLDDDLRVDGALLFEGGLLRSAFLSNSGNRTITVKGDCVLRTGRTSTFPAIADSGDTLLLAGSVTQQLTVSAVTFNPQLLISNGACVMLGTNLTMARSVTVQVGTGLDLNGHNLTATAGITNAGLLQLRGSETVTVPTLNPGSRVRYTGHASPVTVKNWSYKNLAFAAPGCQFNWTAGATYAATEGFTAAGDKALGNITFRSTATNSTWWIDTAGATQAVSRVDVQDSTALGPTIVALYSVNSGNNVNWRFQDGKGTVITLQ